MKHNVPRNSLLRVYNVAACHFDATCYTPHHEEEWAFSNGPHCEKTFLQEFANNKGADQPEHPRRLISAFVIRFLQSVISKLATGEISIF